MTSPVLTAILQRRSVRDFTDEPVPEELVREIIRAGIWAPSGLNNQPWRFVIVTSPAVKEELARQTHYGRTVLNAAVLIAVFLDQEAVYDQVKDQQSAGACIQNMLLAAHDLGLGAVWLGQILKNKEEVRKILGLGEGLELMALLALGHPCHRQQKSSRKELSHFILKHY